MELTEKVAYLKGLVEGLGIDEKSKEGKVFGNIIDILEDMALTISDLEDGMDLMTDQLESMDEDIEELRDDVYDIEDDDDYEGELYEVKCPSCGDTICIDEDMLDEGEIECPGCGENLEFDLDGCLDDCECGHHHGKEE